jgi:hypothetical protein
MVRAKWLVTAVLVLCAAASVVYAASFTNVKGWNYASTFYEGVQGKEGTASDVDIDGEVGHPVYVSSPTALCEPSRSWNLSIEVASGVLPPGLELIREGSDYGAIKGIPTKRGHWIVTMHAYDLKCEGGNYMGFTQQLRFHISGTGEVIQ